MELIYLGHSGMLVHGEKASSVSYTHLDVYKRQAMCSSMGLRW